MISADANISAGADQPQKVSVPDKCPRAPRSFLYCIGSIAGEPVKIGYSANPIARLQGIRAHNANPVQMFWAVPGGKASEAELHRQFAPRLIHGEWYRDPFGEIAGMHENVVFHDLGHPAIAETQALFLSRGGARALREHLPHLDYELFRRMPTLPPDVLAFISALPVVCPKHPPRKATGAAA